MSNEIYEYFMEKYKKANFKVVPGHWPNFKTKEEVDKWLKIMELMLDEY
ncbi:hypothetical protein [Clostridium sp. Marseille-Q2269]|nr:hypothetical protein [Clostridium sp. Marseille-Q2269]